MIHANPLILRALRRVLPSAVKRLLKRLWDPNRTLANDPASLRRSAELYARRTSTSVVSDDLLTSIVVVTYGNIDFTRLCLSSLFANTDARYEVVVVDNASSDGTREFLQTLERDRTEVRTVLNDSNRGFAAANNQGLAIARGERLVLLNNDTVVPPGWTRRLAKHVDDPALGMVNPVTNFSGNESRIDVPYRSIDAFESFARSYTQAHESEIFDINVAAMYCVGMRRDTFEKVGPLDERFGVGMFEDDDYSHRVRLAGLRVVCAEDVFVHHFGQASFRKLGPLEYQELLDRNRRLYEEKWGRPWQPHRSRR